MNTIKNFYNQYVTAGDKLFCGLLLGSVLLGLIYILANQMGHQYIGNAGLSWRWFAVMPLFLGLALLAMYARNMSPRMALLTWSYSVYFFMLIALTTIAVGIQATPFPVIDPWLVKIDQALGFQQLAVLNWTYAHPWALKIFNSCYDLVWIELPAFPMILALMLRKKALKVYFLTIIISFVIGATFYYFFPTTAPTSMFFDPHFAQQQHDTFVKFFEIHHHLPITTTQGGMIAFPSFHVVWAVLLTYMFKEKKYLFYPIAVLNLVIIASTVFLGWHYLVDVLGALVLSALSIWIAEVMYRRYLKAGDQRTQ